MTILQDLKITLSWSFWVYKMQEKRQYFIECIKRNLMFLLQKFLRKIYKMFRSLGQLVSTQPTIGSNIEEINQNNVKFQAWDLGGQENMRTVWDAYYLNTDVKIKFSLINSNNI